MVMIRSSPYKLRRTHRRAVVAVVVAVAVAAVVVAVVAAVAVVTAAARGGGPILCLAKFHVECRQKHVWGAIFGASYDHIYNKMYLCKG